MSSFQTHSQRCGVQKPQGKQKQDKKSPKSIKLSGFFNFEFQTESGNPPDSYVKLQLMHQAKVGK